MISWRSAAAALGYCALTVPLACNRAEKQACRDAYAATQTAIDDTAKTPESFDQTLTKVRATLATCRTAGLDQEVEQLAAVEKALAEQRDRVEKASGRAPKKTLSPEEIGRLEKAGDPSCPKGQAYKHQQTGKEIRCTGPQPIGMGWSTAVAYFQSRDFSVKPKDDPNVLALEHGAELLLFSYARPQDPGPPVCVKIYPPPGASWQEAVSRTTGAAPGTLVKGGTVKTPAGDLRVDVTESATELVVRIGRC